MEKQIMIKVVCRFLLVMAVLAAAALAQNSTEEFVANNRLPSMSYPEAPSTVAITSGTLVLAAAQQQGAEPAVRGSSQLKATEPERPGREPEVVDWKYTTMMGSMFASGFVNVELTNKCLQQHTCEYVPEWAQSRAVMYGIGIPAEFGVAFLGYKLKEHHHGWWWVPAAAVTAANAVVAYHAATRIK